MVNFKRFEHINNLPKFKKDLLQMYSYTIFLLFFIPIDVSITEEEM